MIERRRAKRFQVDWQIRVEGTDDGTGSFLEAGALLFLGRPLSAGTKLDLYILLPLQGKKWMKYPARVVRSEQGIAAVVAAVKFDSARPDFGMPSVPV